MEFPGFTAEAGLGPATQSYRSRATRETLGAAVGAQQFGDGDESEADIEDGEGIEGEDLGEGMEGEEMDDAEAEEVDEEGEAA